VALVRTEISEERVASIIGATIIGDLGTTLPVTSNRSTLRKSNSININISIFRNVLQLLVTVNVIPSSLMLSMYLVFLRRVLQWLVSYCH
jgi:hypothetical protein